jgi:hypothetical protein
MRHAAGLFAISFVVAAAATALAEEPRVADKAPKAPPPTAKGTPALSERMAMLAPIQVESLTLTPIVATVGAAAGASAADPKAPNPSGEETLLVLDEAMSAGKVKIQEIAEGNVNSLTFVNKAENPVFILAGEVIIGGKQDRIIGRNTVIPAKTTQEVPVFCVEHGRWDGKNKQFTTAKALAHGRLRGRASFAAQQDVWNEVAAKNRMRKTTNSSDTYRNVAQQQSDGTLGNMEKLVHAAIAKIPAADRARMVGYAVALNGAVATVDVFGSPSLFQKLETKLVRSYLTESIDIAARKDAKPPTSADVLTFMADAEKASEKKSYDTDAAETSVQAGERAFKAKVGYKRKGGSAADAAKPAPTVYENYQAH